VSNRRDRSARAPYAKKRYSVLAARPLIIQSSVVGELLTLLKNRNRGAARAPHRRPATDERQLPPRPAVRRVLGEHAVNPSGRSRAARLAGAPPPAMGACAASGWRAGAMLSRAVNRGLRPRLRVGCPVLLLSLRVDRLAAFEHVDQGLDLLLASCRCLHVVDAKGERKAVLLTQARQHLSGIGPGGKSSRSSTMTCSK